MVSVIERVVGLSYVASFKSAIKLRNAAAVACTTLSGTYKGHYLVRTFLNTKPPLTAVGCMFPNNIHFQQFIVINYIPMS